MDIVAKATSDGYTLLVTDNALTITPALYKSCRTSLRDFMHIGKVAESPTLLVAALKIPAKTVTEVIELARSRPGELTYGSGGQGSAAHLAMERLLSLGKAKMTHVPFKGVALSIAGVVAGQIDFSFGSLAAGMPHVNAGRVRGIALSGNTRSPLMSAVPTFAEAGFPGYSFVHWWSMAAPAATPAAVVTRIGKEMAAATASERLRNTFRHRGQRRLQEHPRR